MQLLAGMKLFGTKIYSDMQMFSLGEFLRKNINQCILEDMVLVCGWGEGEGGAFIFIVEEM